MRAQRTMAAAAPLPSSFVCLRVTTPSSAALSTPAQPAPVAAQTFAVTQVLALLLARVLQITTSCPTPRPVHPSIHAQPTMVAVAVTPPAPRLVLALISVPAPRATPPPTAATASPSTSVPPATVDAALLFAPILGPIRVPATVLPTSGRTPKINVSVRLSCRLV